MNGTPRLRSSFPLSPPNPAGRNGRLFGDRPGASPSREVPTTKPVQDPATAPLIPFHVVDAPTQRLYVIALYVSLQAWRIWDFCYLESDDYDPTWKFLKWVAIDGLMLFCLPTFKIPWLEWSFATTMAAIFLHVILDAFLMFQIPIPIGAWLVAFGRLFYDRELAVSERRVKAADILHNSSLILGKQIIQILPEGSAVLNPHNEPFCLDGETTSVEIPIRVNQTTPVLIELLRFDLDTNQNETIVIEAKQARKLMNKANKAQSKSDLTKHRDLRHSVSKTGAYRLQRVIDETKLEVQRQVSDTLVVACPHAEIRASHVDKCRGELSDLVLDVRGTPPMKIKYSRAINEVDRASSLQSIQPENFLSPLLRQTGPGPLVNPRQPDFSWVRAQTIPVPLNESLRAGGLWSYTIEEVHDAIGNIMNFTLRNEGIDSTLLPMGPQHQQFTVHDRPRLAFDRCDTQNPLLVAKNKRIDMPLHLQSTGKTLTADMPISVSYMFKPTNPDEDATTEGIAILEEVVLKDGTGWPTVGEAGWYDLKSVSTRFCQGDVLEPASCLLQNPQEPDLSITSAMIPDECGNAIGLEVDLSLVGTPPFKVSYNKRHNGRLEQLTQVVDGFRDQLTLHHFQSGRYTYEFLAVSDKYYASAPLQSKGMVLEQEVKPLASARIVGGRPKRHACIEESLAFEIELAGEGPWKLQYEMLHRGKRASHEIDIDTRKYTITTDKPKSGGEYSLALTGVKDKSGCRRSLNEEIKFDVRHDRPSASFGYIDGKRTVSALDHQVVMLPLRLKGEPSWSVSYKKGRDAPSLFKAVVEDGNGFLRVQEEGRYEIEQVSDRSCQGSVDQSGKVFEVNWIARPTIQVADAPSSKSSGKITQPEICEGDDDVLDLRLTGVAPYRVKYEQRLSPRSGPASVSVKEFTAALGVSSIRMDTTKAGDYMYKVVELSDNLYDHDSRKFTPLLVHQTVHSRPSAAFAKPGTTYAYCKEEAEGDEVIPIKLVGVPPFSLEVSIKHHTQAKSEIMPITKITTHEYNYRVPRQHLDLGAHTVSIHKVQDGRGCQQWYDKRQLSSVRVQVSDVPTISPTETKTDFCVGERISYTLSGLAPFDVFYTFEGRPRKATSSTTNFKRIAETPGEFLITGVSDGASGKCKAHTNIRKVIHGMPSVRISKGKTSRIDIHEGGEADIQFDFSGMPPFQFTYTRSTNAQDGKKGRLLETKREVSYEHSKVIKASEAGVYEVVSIQDKFCAFSIQTDQGNSGQKLLQY